MRKLFFSFVAFSILLCYSCIGNKQKDGINLNQRKEILEEVEMIKTSLPMVIENTPIIMEDVMLQDDMVVFTLSMSKQYWNENFSFGADVINNDKNIARIVNSLDPELVEYFIDAKLGIKYIYKDSDSGENLMHIQADSNRLKKIKEGIDSGEISPLTVLEIFQLELDKFDFPCEMDDGVWFTDGYIKGNNVYYIVSLESDITYEDITSQDLQEMKNGILQGLNESLVRIHKKEMLNKGICITYVYKNKDGVEFARVDISADDL